MNEIDYFSVKYNRPDVVPKEFEHKLEEIDEQQQTIIEEQQHQRLETQLSKDVVVISNEKKSEELIVKEEEKSEELIVKEEEKSEDAIVKEEEKSEDAIVKEEKSEELIVKEEEKPKTVKEEEPLLESSKDTELFHHGPDQTYTGHSLRRRFLSILYDSSRNKSFL